jgi:hypothetical protein
MAQRRLKHTQNSLQGNREAKKNKIKLLRTDDGQITKNRSEMEGMARNCFMQLYSTDQKVRPTELLQAFEPTISYVANASLCKEFSDDEIRDAMFQIGPIKALGPDGFPALFSKGTGPP